jgi:hypothetical protein
MALKVNQVNRPKEALLFANKKKQTTFVNLFGAGETAQGPV